MRQVLSDKQTIYTQTVLSVLVTLLLLYFAWFKRIGPGWAYDGFIGPAVYIWLVIVASVSIVGGLMYAINLLFYRIQVYRHGLPHKQIETDD